MSAIFSNFSIEIKLKIKKPYHLYKNRDLENSCHDFFFYLFFLTSKKLDYGSSLLIRQPILQ